MTQNVAAIIVAAGRGSRAGPGAPKQWRQLRGKTVARRTVDLFRTHPAISRILVVHHPDEASLAKNLGRDLLFCPGGETRDASVLCGLRALAFDPPDIVLIHDVARPFATHASIDGVLGALDTADGAAPALPVTDALWTGAENLVTGTADRSGLFRAQTPQGFRFSAILAAHEAHHGPAADDVEIARAAGLTVAITPGSEDNFKITFEDDFRRAESMLESDMDVRIGNGFDVHRFGPGDHVTLCGVDIPHGRGLQGHSDADVGLHTVTDAIYGALAEGDIGRHFPPSDPQWKGAASRIFLEHAVGLAAARGFRISNVDLTLVCESPKIGPHAAEMTAKMAQIMDLPVDRISIKATTSERLGFTGREEGIAAIATVTVLK